MCMLTPTALKAVKLFRQAFATAPRRPRVVARAIRRTAEAAARAHQRAQHTGAAA